MATVTIATLRKLRDTAQRDRKGEWDWDAILNRELYPFLNALRVLITDSGGTGVISSSIVADQNDFTPAGHLTSYFVRVDTDASRTITGLLATDFAAPFRRKTYTNVGANPLVLAHEDAGSAAENRIIVPGAVDLTLLTDESADVWYDPSSQRARVI